MFCASRSSSTATVGMIADFDINSVNVSAVAVPDAGSAFALMGFGLAAGSGLVSATAAGGQLRQQCRPRRRHHADAARQRAGWPRGYALPIWRVSALPSHRAPKKGRQPLFRVSVRVSRHSNSRAVLQSSLAQESRQITLFATIRRDAHGVEPRSPRPALAPAARTVPPRPRAHCSGRFPAAGPGNAAWPGYSVGPSTTTTSP